MLLLLYTLRHAVALMLIRCHAVYVARRHYVAFADVYMPRYARATAADITSIFRATLRHDITLPADMLLMLFATCRRCHVELLADCHYC